MTGGHTLSLILYVLSVLAANVVTANMPPLHVLGLLIPMGSFLIGITLLLRNFVQVRWGKRFVYVAIAVALILSAIASRVLGDVLAVTIASAISFAVSETSDTEIFTRMKNKMWVRIVSGGSVGGVLDSIIFVTIGLSPIGAGFVPWAQIPLAILGQLLVKVLMQWIFVWFISSPLSRRHAQLAE